MRRTLLACLALSLAFSVQSSLGNTLSQDGKTSYVIVVATFVHNLHVKDFKPGEYKTFDLGTHPLKGNSYFGIVSSGKGDKSRKAYVDRMIFIQKD